MKYEKKAPLIWNGRSLELLDQRLLPHQQVVVNVTTVKECYDAIRDMVVRGAPLIGFTGIWGAVLSCINNGNFEEDIAYLKEARPTAINLVYELDRCLGIFRTNGPEGLKEKIIDFANEQMAKLGRDNQKMADLALEFMDKNYHSENYTFLTICNTGYLACGPMGTALGVISNANSKNRLAKAYATETRPYLQGSRLTAYEMMTEEIPFEIIVEGAFSYLLKTRKIDAIFAGADRIARNGDTANKIGTSTLAIVAKEYGVPFFIVAPTSSFDLQIAHGDQIPIELRDEKEITHISGQAIAPIGARALNPSFDVTSSKHITGIFCENGVITDFDPENVRRIVQGE
ncbi:S-methyl-5-thioribose-1-phosphate isomerase [Bacteriovorax sp. Seq25_V]|uniref:S-methyl-5-thioribose-1-phosphate isomerase n=1 Tax=Bacteriovorax sp. Seq25_V TaxID=1201288 RepID=UPI00038A5142|nr:S-methyl-5-thioribose-1-phosphate isomerase [Bacteriovorax sp. Seq25_V]EQC43572.1 S-methyl-5-thioribose-1-phosphate isomerase [Bacteriovorax sp. Seq25_V]